MIFPKSPATVSKERPFSTLSIAFKLAMEISRDSKGIPLSEEHGLLLSYPHSRCFRRVNCAFLTTLIVVKTNHINKILFFSILLISIGYSFGKTRVCMHSNQVNVRGTEVTTRSYARWLLFFFPEEIEVILLAPRLVPVQSKLAMHAYSDEFRMAYYETVMSNWSYDHGGPGFYTLANALGCDVVYMKVHGDCRKAPLYNVCDYPAAQAVPLAIHAVFKASKPWGDAFAAISEDLARKSGNLTNFVNHIVPPCKPDSMCPAVCTRRRLGIPEDAYLVCRHGGWKTFNIPFVRKVVYKIVKEYKSVHFAFVNTDPRGLPQRHGQIHFLKSISSLQEKYSFIDACDVMLHARKEGETFGNSIAEFSSCNKPVMVWSGSKRDTAHFDLLGDCGYKYSNESDLLELIRVLQFKHNPKHAQKRFERCCSPKVVVNSFVEVFVKPLIPNGDMKF